MVTCCVCLPATGHFRSALCTLLVGLALTRDKANSFVVKSGPSVEESVEFDA